MAVMAKPSFVYIAWLIALAATVGSLYFSEVMRLAPCLLCWYQRIFMYPLTFIIPIGILRQDRGLALYVLPLSSIGVAIALYHNLLYYRFIPEQFAPCRVGVSCTERAGEWFGFASIPFLSFTAFSAITILMFLRAKRTAA